MKLTIREGMVPGASLGEQLAWLQTMGIDAVELHGASMGLPANELRRHFEGSPIAVSAIEGVPALLNADPGTRDAAKEQIRHRLRLAGELGAVGVLIVPQFGRAAALPDLSPYKTGADLERELLLAQLCELAPDAERSGVTLFLEPLNRYEAYIVNRIEQGAAIARQIGPQVATMADLFHMGIEEADLPESIRANAGHIVYVHVADSNRLQPGRGHLDFQPSFEALKEIGYDGYLGIECRVDGPYDDAIRESVAFLREQWEKA
jgi:sugar phosphate isomerase/epimerase